MSMLGTLEIAASNDNKLHSSLLNRAQDVEEVIALPDNISLDRHFDKTSSKLTIDRVRQKQQEKHVEMRDEFKEKLSEISSEYENVILKASQNLKEHLNLFTEHIDQITTPLTDRSHLVSLNYSDLESCWTQVLGLCQVQQDSVESFTKVLSDIEESKSYDLNRVFRNYCEYMTSIGYLTAPECVSLLEKESGDVNITLIANQKSCNQLLFRLRVNYITQEKKYYDSWLSTVSLWKELRIDAAVREFNLFMTSSEIVSPKEFQQILTNLTSKHSEYNSERYNLIADVKSLVPSSVSNSIVHKWCEQLRSCNNQLVVLNTQHIMQLNNYLTKLHQDCLDEASSVKSVLFSCQVCDEDALINLMNEKFLPPIEELHNKHEDMIHSIEQSLDSLLTHQFNQITELVSFCKENLTIWESHQNQLRDREKEIQEELDNCRREHNEKNHHLEASLDMWLDRLRQAPGQAELESHFNQGKKYLRNIQEGYEEFYHQMSSIVKKYPNRISIQVSEYEDSLLKGLYLSKTMPKQPKKKLQSDSVPSSGRSTRSSSFTGGVRQHVTPFHIETLTTENGTSYYWLVKPEVQDVINMNNNFFITQNQSNKENQETVEFAMSNINLPSDMLLTFQKEIVLGYLNHLESWKIDSDQRGDSVISAKLEEFKSELELRKHLHEPRQSKIEQDIQIVRVYELSIHQDRLNRHLECIKIMLAELNSQLDNDLFPGIKRSVRGFQAKMKEIEACICDAEKHTEMSHIISTAENCKKAQIDNFRSIMNQFRQTLEESLLSIRDSNMQFRTSLTPFSEGGNFAPEEIENFSRKLEAIVKNINTCESDIIAKIDLKESQQHQDILEIYSKLSDKIELNVVDVNFLERIEAKFKEIQLKIKIETASSNSQAQAILIAITSLREFITKLDTQQEHIDTEVNKNELNGIITSLYDSCMQRIYYMYCYHETFDDKNSPKSKFQKATADVITVINTTRSMLSPANLKCDSLQKSIPSTEKATQSHVKVRSSSSKSHASSSAGAASSSDKIYSFQKKKGLSRYQLLRQPNFGLEGGDDTNNSTSFLPKIRSLLYSTNTELFNIIDSFYRARNPKASHFSESLPETSEMCMLNVNHRLHSYRSQVEAYRLSCIKEFINYLHDLNETLKRLPKILCEFVLFQTVACLQAEKKKLDSYYKNLLSESEETKSLHKKKLRSNLGHPSNRQLLKNLCDLEDKRHQSSLEAIKERSNKISTVIRRCGEDFSSKISDYFNFLLELLKYVMLPQDVSQKQKISTEAKELGVILEDQVIKTTPINISHMYLDLPDNWVQMPIEQLEQLTLIPNKTIPQPSTKLHDSLFTSRDNVLVAFLQEYLSELKEVKHLEGTGLVKENLFNDCWNNSISELKALFT